MYVVKVRIYSIVQLLMFFYINLEKKIIIIKEKKKIIIKQKNVFLCVVFKDLTTGFESYPFLMVKILREITGRRLQLRKLELQLMCVCMYIY